MQVDLNSSVCFGRRSVPHHAQGMRVLLPAPSIQGAIAIAYGNHHTNPTEMKTENCQHSDGLAKGIERKTKEVMKKVQ